MKTLTDTILCLCAEYVAFSFVQILEAGGERKLNRLLQIKSQLS